MRSKQCFKAAQRVVPGGVHSPVRSFRSVGGTPRFMASAQGAYLHDVDGNRYVDYISAYGPAILGHAHPEVVEAIQQACHRGLCLGTPSPVSTELCELIQTFKPHLERIRLVNSGTEACMSALRLARGITGRNHFVKFIGGYHGHEDNFLVSAGSGATTLGVPSSPGVPEASSAYTLLADFNDLEAVRARFEQHPEDIAAIFVEPIAGNMGFILPEPGFLEGLRDLCDQYQALLIFDEVMTGFRIHPGGAVACFGVTPDLTTFGKIIGGGLPVGAVGGKADLMEHLAPSGPVYQAGTLSGNPITVASGLATLKLLQAHPERYEALFEHTQALCTNMVSLAKGAGISLHMPHLGAMFGIYFSEHAPRNYGDAVAADHDRFRHFFHGMLERGVHFAPSGYEAGFTSMAHDQDTMDQTLSAFEHVLKHLPSSS